MKVEEKNEKLVISEGKESLSADISGLTKKQVKHLSRQMQIDFLEGKRDKKKKTSKKVSKKVSKKQSKKEE